MSSSLKNHRVVFRIEVPSDTAQKFLEMCEETGISQIALTSKLVHWFKGLDPELQNRILGVHGDAARSEATKLILQKLIKSGSVTQGDA